jgi:hypothetical protein
MARKLYFHTSAEDPRRALIKGLDQTTIGPKPVFVRGDNNPTEIYLVAEPGGYHSDSGSGSVTPKLAIVTPGATPTGGTFKVEHSANASTAIAYNETAANLETILNAIASVSAAGGVTVSGESPCWTITWVNTGAQSDFTENDNSLTPDGSIGISKITDGDGSTQEVIAFELKRQPHTIQTTWSTITNGWSADFAMVDQKLCDLLNGAASVETTLELEVTDASGKIRTYAQVPCLLLGDGINTGAIANQVGSTYYTAAEADNLFCKRAQDLADLASASTARGNLGIDATTTPFTPTVAGDWTTAPTEVGGALDELADRTNGISATKTEGTHISISAAGTTDLDPTDDKALSTFFVSATAGAGSYTHDLILQHPAGGETGQAVLIRVDIAASANPTLRIYDEGPLASYTDDVLEITLVGSAKAATSHFLLLVWDDTNTEWDLIHDTRGSGVGLQTIWVPAKAMTPRSTNGAASGSSETTTNKVMIESLDFDQSTIEYAQFDVAFPAGWNAGTVWAQFVWTSTVNSNDVIWGIQGVSVENDEAIDVAFGTAQEVTDTALAASDIHTSSETGAITIAGASAAGLTYFQVYRDAADAGDTLAADAQLLGVKLMYVTTTASDY